MQAEALDVSGHSTVELRASMPGWRRASLGARLHWPRPDECLIQHLDERRAVVGAGLAFVHLNELLELRPDRNLRTVKPALLTAFLSMSESVDLNHRLPGNSRRHAFTFPTPPRGLRPSIRGNRLPGVEPDSPSHVAPRRLRTT
jgi:hypothetical protein